MSPRPDDERDIAEIESQIDQTRNAISGDLRTLGERSRPEHLKEEAKEMMLEAKNVALIGVGVTWFMSNRRSRDREWQATEDHPLAVGAAAVAAGICVGLMLPATRREHEVLGRPRDRLVGEAKEAVQDWTHAAKEAARDVKSTLSGSAS